MTAICKGLYLGDVRDAFSKELEKYPTAVLNCTKDIPRSPYAKAYMNLSLEDIPSERIEPHFAAANEFIEEHLNQGMRVLVHCRAGISRSASIVIAYIMHKHNIPFHTAHSYVKSKRPIIDPNLGFVFQLSAYEGKCASEDIHSYMNVCAALFSPR